MNEQALILRLAACELTGETRSIFVLRRILRDKGWDDARLDDIVARVKKTVGQMQQLDLFERAA